VDARLKTLIQAKGTRGHPWPNINPGPRHDNLVSLWSHVLEDAPTLPNDPRFTPLPKGPPAWAEKGEGALEDILDFLKRHGVFLSLNSKSLFYDPLRKAAYQHPSGLIPLLDYPKNIVADSAFSILTVIDKNLSLLEVRRRLVSPEDFRQINTDPLCSDHQRMHECPPCPLTKGVCELSMCDVCLMYGNLPSPCQALQKCHYQFRYLKYLAQLKRTEADKYYEMSMISYIKCEYKRRGRWEWYVFSNFLSHCDDADMLYGILCHACYGHGRRARYVLSFFSKQPWSTIIPSILWDIWQTTDQKWVKNRVVVVLGMLRETRAIPYLKELAKDISKVWWDDNTNEESEIGPLDDDTLASPSYNDLFVGAVITCDVQEVLPYLEGEFIESISYGSLERLMRFRKGVGLVKKISVFNHIFVDMSAEWVGKLCEDLESYGLSHLAEAKNFQTLARCLRDEENSNAIGHSTRFRIVNSLRESCGRRFLEYFAGYPFELPLAGG
jgi:hypothetical protein